MAKARGFTAHLVIGNADTLNSKAPACRVMIGGQGLYYYGVKNRNPQSGEMNRTGFVLMRKLVSAPLGSRKDRDWQEAGFPSFCGR